MVTKKKKESGRKEKSWRSKNNRILQGKTLITLGTIVKSNIRESIMIIKRKEDIKKKERLRKKKNLLDKICLQANKMEA